MASGVTLDDIKAHVVAVDFSDDDALLQGYLTAAEEWVAAYLRRDMSAAFPDGWPAPVQQAVKLMVARFYEHRIDDADAGAPLVVQSGLKDMLAPYRAFV